MALNLATKFDLSSFQGLNFNRLLRKEVIDRVIVSIQVLVAAIALASISIAIKELLRSRVMAKTFVSDLENSLVDDVVPNPPLPNRSAADYSVLNKQPLFGEIQTAAKPTAAIKPASNTALALIGVYLEDGQEPYAIIEDKKKANQEVFNVNDLIFGDATLKKIMIDRVQIERLGQIEELVLDELSDSKGGESKGGVASTDENQYVVDEGELDKALENLPLLLTQARAVPYFKDGVSIGLRLFAIKSGSMFERLGLKNGDILKAVNNNSLGDITQAVKLFETLKQERSLGVKLERNSEDKEIHYEIR